MRIECSAERLQQAYVETEGAPAWSASRALIEKGELPSEMFRALAVAPGALNALAAFGDVCYPGGRLERSIKERVIVAVSRQNTCQYCTVSHSRTMQRLGFSEDPAALTERERLALTYAHAAILDANEIPEEVFADLRRVFDDEEIVELTLLVGLHAMLNLFNSALQVRYPE